MLRKALLSFILSSILIDSAHCQTKKKDEQKKTIKNNSKKNEKLSPQSPPPSPTQGMLSIATQEKNQELSYLASDTKTGQSVYTSWKAFIEDPTPSLANLKQFINDYPDWPMIKDLCKKVEKGLTYQMPEDEVLQWFNAHPPITLYGITLYAKTLLRKGQTDRAHRLIKKTWKEVEDDKDLEQFKKDFETILTAQDHQARLDMLLTKEKVLLAQKTIEWLNQQLEWFPVPQRDLAKMRIDLLNNDPKQKEILEKRLKETKFIFKNDSGLLYEELKWRRKNKENEAVLTLFQDEAVIAAERANPLLFWGERNIMVRRMVEEKSYEKAYNLLQGHQLKDGEHYVNAEWLASFILLKYLNKPDEAHDRLKKLIDKVRMPISYSRIYYWLSVAAQKMKSKQQQIEWLKKGAEHFGTYYGQLCLCSLEDLGEKQPEIALFQEDNFSPAIKEKFEKRDIVQALQFMLKNQEPMVYVERFFTHLENQIDDVDEYALLVNLASRLAPAKFAVQLSRKAKDKMIITKGTYPVLDDAFLNQTVNKLITNNFLFPHIVHAVIRRESAFDANAVSSAGAKGLMQVMDFTAKRTIDKLSFLCGEACKNKDTYAEPVNNVAIGTMYLKEQLETYNGSVVLALCAYNAGPEALNNLFCTTIGNPLEEKVDIIEWVELIPYYETRNYVQRVLENFMIYLLRAKINNSSIPSIRFTDLLSLGIKK